MLYLAMKLARIVILVLGMMVVNTGSIMAAYDNSVWCGDSLGSIMTGDGVYSGNPKINTALGCIPIKPAEFIKWLMPWLLGVGGGISFLLMVYGFILMTTSAGDPKAVQGAQETITSAIMGLLVCVFALFLIRLISVDILHIPGIN